MFTDRNSINEIMAECPPLISVFFDRSFLQLVPEPYRDRPLEEVKTAFLLPWGQPFPADQMVEDANLILEGERYWELIPLWSPVLTVETGDAASVFLMRLKDDLKGKRPAVLICPGGGYENLSFGGEGVRTAMRLQKYGCRTFVLRYRVSPNRYPAPQLDLLLAVKYLRANAERFQIDPGDLMILGYSAGGHLCASSAALAEELDGALTKAVEAARPEFSGMLQGVSSRPDKVCLCYPVITFLGPRHEPSFQCLTGGDESLRAPLSIETRVTPDYPETFLWTCADDSLVPPFSTESMRDALARCGVRHKCVIYPQGEHGCCLGEGTSAEGWTDEMAAFFRKP